MKDVLEGQARWQIHIPPHGLVALVDVMPRLVPTESTADSAIVQAARVSYGEGTKQASEDRGLIRYLMRHRHTTPFEMVEFKFHCVMPIFVARQWVRHRTASINEYSARYSIVQDRFYRPSTEDLRQQSATNKQGGAEPVSAEISEEFGQYLKDVEAHYEEYKKVLGKGVSRELARIGLPLSIYTELYWKIDLHNLFHFLGLRMGLHAQKEIRDYADAISALIKPVVPLAYEAFIDYRFGAITLSRLEIEAISKQQPLASDNKREQSEWQEKKDRLGL